MKKNKILGIIGGLSIAVAGVTAVIGGLSNKEVEVKADSTIDIYFTNNQNWSNLKCHHWIDGGAGTTWPGDDMDFVYNNGMGQAIYKISIDSLTSGVIFNSDGVQTIDIKSGIKNNGGFYLLDDTEGGKYKFGTWDVKPYTVAFNANGGSGSMESYTAYADVEWKISKNLFTRTGYVFDGWNTKVDGTGDWYGDEVNLPKDEFNAGETVTLYAQWNHASGRYLVGNFGACSWGIEGAVYMEHKNDQYEASITLQYGDELKCAYYNGSGLSSFFGYDDVLATCGAYYCFGSNDENLKCYATGTYNFYFTDGSWSGKKMTIEISGSVGAEHLAAKLMGADISTGTCADRFPGCKEMYLGLSGEEQEKFRGFETSTVEQFKNAYDRYVAWATALHENPWAEGSSSARNILAPIIESNAATWIIVAVSLAGLTAIGGFFYYKKRKEN